MVPLRYLGEGGFQAPGAFAKKLDAALVIGEVLRWEQVPERSLKSHKFYFATIADAWANLPESLVDEFPSPEALRKFALIKAGYCDISKVILRNNQEAVTLMGIMSAMDTYALFEVSGNMLTIWRAHSQSMRAMGKKKFEESKSRVLDVISGLIGADATQAGMAA